LKKGIGADINKQTGTGAGYFLQFDGKALRIVKTTRTIHHMTILEIYSLTPRCARRRILSMMWLVVAP
jgi:hypothetical protein